MVASTNIGPVQVRAICEVGRRANNEDAVYPSEKLAVSQLLRSRVFAVCDGVGGLDKGEEASRIVSELIGAYFANVQHVNEAQIQEAVFEAENRISDYVELEGISGEIASTLAMVHFGENGITTAHVGDSRIYQVRGGEIIFKSRDHSFVNELVQQGVITPKEALSHPKRNVVTRAITVSSHRHAVEINSIQDIQPNDYFLLCSDGVTESVSDDVIRLICGDKDKSIDQKMYTIQDLCREKSRDNYSAYLIQLGGSNTGEIRSGVNGSKNHGAKVLLAMVILGLVAAGIILGLSFMSEPEAEKTPQGGKPQPSELPVE